MRDNETLKFKRNLTALVEFSRIINSSLDLNFILNNVLLTCMGKFLATRGLIALNENNSMILKTSKGLEEKLIEAFPKIPADENCDDNDDLKSYMSETNLKIAEKISASDECVGMISLGEKLNHSEYTEDDKEFLRTILNIAATAIQNSLVVNQLQKVNRKLDSRIQRLNALFELSKEFGLFSESTKVAKLLIFSVIGQFLVSKYAVVNFEGKTINLLESKFNRNELLNILNNYNFTEIESSVNKEVINEKYSSLSELGVDLIVPMQIQGKTKGLILLGERINKKAYSESDIEFIYSVGGLAIISLENKKLFQEALEKQKMEEELDIAREIQRNLLPYELPKYDNFQIAAINLSSQQVGGDYYDVISLDEQRCCTAIADVSGKGVPASLLMANIQAFLQIICHQELSRETDKELNIKLSEATAIMNDLISENISDGKFITFFWGILDSDEKSFHYVNAGHNPPLLVRDGKIIKLEKGGIILGVMNTVMPYNSETVQLQKDDAIIMFTDGISEAMNTEGKEFSDERLEQLCLDVADKSADEILNCIKDEVQTYAKGTIQSDDITMIVIKVN